MTFESPHDEISERGDFAPSQAFLATHRGQAAFAREYSRLVTAMVADVGAAARENPAFAPLIRQSPERCIVPVSYTHQMCIRDRSLPDSPPVNDIQPSSPRPQADTASVIQRTNSDPEGGFDAPQSAAYPAEFP